MQNNSMQCNAIQYSAPVLITLTHCANAIPFLYIQWNTIQCNTIQFNAKQFNAMQFKEKQPNAIIYSVNGLTPQSPPSICPLVGYNDLLILYKEMIKWKLPENYRQMWMISWSFNNCINKWKWCNDWLKITWTEGSSGLIIQKPNWYVHCVCNRNPQGTDLRRQGDQVWWYLAGWPSGMDVGDKLNSRLEQELIFSASSGGRM